MQMYSLHCTVHRSHTIDSGFQWEYVTEHCIIRIFLKRCSMQNFVVSDQSERIGLNDDDCKRSRSSDLNKILPKQSKAILQSLIPSQSQLKMIYWSYCYSQQDLSEYYDGQWGLIQDMMDEWGMGINFLRFIRMGMNHYQK